MILRLFLLSLVAIHFQAFGSAGSAGTAAAPAQKTALVGSGGVEELMAQQSSCAPAAEKQKPWETPVQDIAGRSPTFSPDRRLLAVANGSSNSVSVFSVDIQGMLFPVNGCPFATGNSPDSVKFSPDGRLLVVANIQSNSISVFSISVQGVILPVEGSPFAMDISPESVAFSPDGKLLAVVSSDSNSVLVFSIDSKGVLSPVHGSPFQTGRGPYLAEFSADSKLLMVANGRSDSISAFSISAGGVVSSVQGSPFEIKNNYKSITFSTDRKLLAVISGEFNRASLFSVNAQGAPSPIQESSVATGNNPRSSTFSPDDRFLAVVNNGSKSVSVFSVNGQGIMSSVKMSLLETGEMPGSPIFSPDSRLLIVTNSNSDSVSAFSINEQDMWAPVQGSPFKTGIWPRSATFSPNGRFLAVLNGLGKTIWMYEVDSGTGTISLITGHDLKRCQEARKVLSEPLLLTNNPRLGISEVLHDYIVGPDHTKQVLQKQDDQEQETHVFQATSEDRQKRMDQDTAALFHAIRAGNLEQVKKHLTEQTIFRSYEHEHFRTPLLDAIIKEKTEIGDYILEKSIESDPNFLRRRYLNGNTLLMDVIKAQKYDYALKIAQEMSPDELLLKNNENKTALDIANQMHKFASESERESHRALLDYLRLKNVEEENAKDNDAKAYSTKAGSKRKRPECK